MSRILFILFSVGLTQSAFAAPATFEEKLEEAREEAADRDWEDAIPQYEALAKEVGETPRGELVAVELASAYFSSGALSKAVALSDQFLKVYVGSIYTPQVEHLKAFSLWSQGFFEESLAVFAVKTWEQLRMTNPKMRPRLYGVLAKALRGGEHEYAARATRAESRGVLKNAKGSWVLTGPVRDTVDRLDTEEGWQTLLKQVSPRVRAKLASDGFDVPLEKAKQKKPPPQRIILGLAPSFSSVITTSTVYSQAFLKILGEFNVPLSFSGSNVSVYVGMDAVGIQRPPTNEEVRWLDTGFLLEGRVVGGEQKGFSASLNVGMFYRHSFTGSLPTPRLIDALGVEVYPSFQYEFPNSSQLALYAKVSPYIQSMRTIDLKDNFIAGGGLDYWFPMGAKPYWFNVFLEGEKTSFKLTDGSLFHYFRFTTGLKARL